MSSSKKVIIIVLLIVGILGYRNYTQNLNRDNVKAAATRILEDREDVRDALINYLSDTAISIYDEDKYIDTTSAILDTAMKYGFEVNTPTVEKDHASINVTIYAAPLGIIKYTDEIFYDNFYEDSLFDDGINYYSTLRSIIDEPGDDYSEHSLKLEFTYTGGTWEITTQSSKDIINAILDNPSSYVEYLHE